MNRITIELCAEDRARIDRLTEALEGQARGYVLSETLSAPEPVEPEQPENVQAPEEEAPAPAVEAPAAPEAPSVTKPDVQRKVVELSAAGKKAEVREIITAYATKVSDIPEDKVAEVWQKLTALEG